MRVEALTSKKSTHGYAEETSNHKISKTNEAERKEGEKDVWAWMDRDVDSGGGGTHLHQTRRAAPVV